MVNRVEEGDDDSVTSEVYYEMTPEEQAQELREIEREIDADINNAGSGLAVAAGAAPEEPTVAMETDTDLSDLEYSEHDMQVKPGVPVDEAHNSVRAMFLEQSVYQENFPEYVKTRANLQKLAAAAQENERSAPVQLARTLSGGGAPREDPS